MVDSVRELLGCVREDMKEWVCVACRCCRILLSRSFVGDQL